jgi:hypothetical protein
MKLVRSRKGISLLIAVVLTALIVAGCGGGEEGEITVLRWGLIPADDATEMIRAHRYGMVWAFLIRSGC